MPKRDPQIDARPEWIGFVRPTGLVVSAAALVRAGAVLPRDPEEQRRLRACVAERAVPARRRARAVAARLPGVRGVGARLELLAEGLRGDGREPDSARAGDAAAAAAAALATCHKPPRRLAPPVSLTGEGAPFRHYRQPFPGNRPRMCGLMVSSRFRPTTTRRARPGDGGPILRGVPVTVIGSFPPVHSRWTPAALALLLLAGYGSLASAQVTTTGNVRVVATDQDGLPSPAPPSPRRRRTRRRRASGSRTPRAWSSCAP